VRRLASRVGSGAEAGTGGGGGGGAGAAPWDAPSECPAEDEIGLRAGSGTAPELLAELLAGPGPPEAAPVAGFAKKRGRDSESAETNSESVEGGSDVDWEVGPCIYCLPRHRVPIYSRDEGSECVG